jgi:hypothetical protein
VFGGGYLAIARDSANDRVAFALTGGGALAGLAGGWIATAPMAAEPPPAKPPAVSWHPTASPTTGGGSVGVVGSF